MNRLTTIVQTASICGLLAFNFIGCERSETTKTSGNTNPSPAPNQQREGSTLKPSSVGDGPDMEATGYRVDIRRALNKGDIKEAQNIATQLKAIMGKVSTPFKSDMEKILKEVEDTAAGKVTTKPVEKDD